MSYPRELADYTDDELRAELTQREECRATGVCDYCKRVPQTSECRYPERHRLPDIQTSDITIDPAGKVLFCRPDYLRLSSGSPVVGVVKDIQEYQQELFSDKWVGYDVVVDREAHVVMSTLGSDLKVAIVGYPSLDGVGSAVNVAWQLQAQAEMAQEYLAQQWLSYAPCRPGAEVGLEMQLRAEKTRVLLNWGDRRDARVHQKMLGNQASVYRKCRECGQAVEVGSNYMLTAHTHGYTPSGSSLWCEGGGCSCPEDRVIQESDPRKIDVHIDGNCVVHGVNVTKLREGSQ